MNLFTTDLFQNISLQERHAFKKMSYTKLIGSLITLRMHVKEVKLLSNSYGHQTGTFKKEKTYNKMPIFKYDQNASLGSFCSIFYSEEIVKDAQKI